ncbi:DNA/RNA nuclease SfsA [Dissulfurirhabdus thermomarina]|uniref:Sugar fermentation stimulation protein homolog n=1 Tax=Dissulfurirhabdus thermomarina TaxID=1765737 RepID=A0A6N9TQY8_DISTH|nr:DNA/RNA nuclease SfsA [Dissulfurirhabdus thermomarina]NDY43488.1 DNA/RNA nuclease SfsA [Dissulfurirhabdus thermomarina]
MSRPPLQPLLALVPDGEGIFRSRENRFAAVVDVVAPEPAAGERVHVHDPGRLEDLLVPGRRVLLRRGRRPGRRTRWDVVAAASGGEWILVHAGWHRPLAEALFARPELCPLGPVSSVRAEVPLGRGRLDFRLDRPSGGPVWVEVKGCTLARDGVALFPDAPTARGARHLEALSGLRAAGEAAALLVFVFRPEARAFAPNAALDPRFAAAFDRARAAGVQVHPLHFRYTGREIFCLGPLPVTPPPGA